MPRGQRRLIEGEHYRVDTLGRLVFTSAYLLKRGVCCGSKCRNCPYAWEFVPAEDKVAGEPQPPLDSEDVAIVMDSRRKGLSTDE